MSVRLGAGWELPSPAPCSPWSPSVGAAAPGWRCPSWCWSWRWSSSRTAWTDWSESPCCRGQSRCLASGLSWWSAKQHVTVALTTYMSDELRLQFFKIFQIFYLFIYFCVDLFFFWSLLSPPPGCSSGSPPCWCRSGPSTCPCCTESLPARQSSTGAEHTMSTISRACSTFTFTFRTLN